MAQRHLNRNQFYILASVLCSMFLAALDQTIVATAAPNIASELNDFEAISWLFSSYMLASTVLIPIYGKLSDIYGRRVFYLGGILVFLLGSVLCGIALTMPWIIAARALQGLGAGAIMVESFTIIGDLFPPAERGKWQGLISSMFGLASICGPLLGGLLSDYASWRWIFFINVPIGIVAMLLTHYHFPVALQKGVKQKINYGSAALLAMTLLAFLFALVRSEAHNTWLSPDIIFIFALSFVLLVAFIYTDKRAKEPIFPGELFQNKTFTLSIIAVFLTTICSFAAISYIPLFVQMALSRSASASGLILIPLVLALTIASTLSGQIVSRTGKYKALLLTGLVSMCFGTYFLSRMDTVTTIRQLTLNMILVGGGMGISLPIFIVIVQSSFGHDKLGLVTSSMQLVRNIGATLGTAMFGTLIINEVEKNLVSISLKDLGINKVALRDFPQILRELETRAGNTEMLLLLRHNFAQAISGMFGICTLLSLVALIVVLFLPIIRLRKTNRSLN